VVRVTHDDQSNLNQENEMQDYQQRVVDEQIELNEKLVKLIQFSTTETYRKLPVVDRDLLIEQQGAMAAYNNILGDRIARFAD